MKKTSAVAGMIMLSFAVLVNGQSRFDKVTIETIPVSGAVYALLGAGGNIGVSAGADGIIIVDDQYAPLAEKIAIALGELGSDKPKYIINTHYHGDHTGTNAYFQQQKDATIFAHTNVRIRLANGEDVDPASLPVVTYETGVQIHFNRDTIHVFHLPNAHTDGDSAVWFEHDNVLHPGDLFFNELFPYIDLDAGGSVQGYIDAVENLISKIDQRTAIIPGHGKIGNKADFQRFVDMIKTTNALVDDMQAQGLSEDDAVKAGLPEEWKSWSWRFITEERWIRTLYRS